RRLLLRTERLPGRQGVLLPSINILRALAPPRLLEHPVADPFALCPHWRQLLHETPHRQCEFSPVPPDAESQVTEPSRAQAVSPRRVSSPALPPQAVASRASSHGDARHDRSRRSSPASLRPVPPARWHWPPRRAPASAEQTAVAIRAASLSGCSTASRPAAWHPAFSQTKRVVN